MSPSTIEGHLAALVAKGILPSIDFISSERTETVIAVSKKLDTFILGPIKQALGDEFTYGEIRMALAAHLATSSEK